MPSDPIHSATSPHAEQRPAVWPWLLLPLVALTIFLALSKAKESATSDSHHPDAADSAVPSEDTGSR